MCSEVKFSAAIAGSAAADAKRSAAMLRLWSANAQESPVVREIIARSFEVEEEFLPGFSLIDIRWPRRSPASTRARAHRRFRRFVYGAEKVVKLGEKCAQVCGRGPRIAHGGDCQLAPQRVKGRHELFMLLNC